VSLSTAISSHICPNGRFSVVTGIFFFVTLSPFTSVSEFSFPSMLSSSIPVFNCSSSSSSLSSKYRSSSSLSPPPLILSPCISSFCLSFVFACVVLFCGSFLLIRIDSFRRFFIGSIKWIILVFNFDGPLLLVHSLERSVVILIRKLCCEVSCR
jgi:hypothetical protein